MSTAIIRSLFLQSEKFFLFVSCREPQHRALVNLDIDTIVEIEHFYTMVDQVFLVRRMLIRKNLEFCPCLYVFPFLHNAFSQNPFITFFKTLQLLRACKGGKISKRLFEKILFCPFWPKTSKIGHFDKKWRFFAFSHNQFFRIC